VTTPTWSTLSIDTTLALRTAAARLDEGFTGTFGTETIERFFHSTYDQPAARAAVTKVLPLMAERFARHGYAPSPKWKASISKASSLSCSYPPTTPAGPLRHRKPQHPDAFTGCLAGRSINGRRSCSRRRVAEYPSMRRTPPARSSPGRQTLPGTSLGPRSPTVLTPRC
jgi:hypothetical protein